MQVEQYEEEREDEDEQDDDEDEGTSGKCSERFMLSAIFAKSGRLILRAANHLLANFGLFRAVLCHTIGKLVELELLGKKN